jgi:hypothetical protein
MVVLDVVVAGASQEERWRRWCDGLGSPMRVMVSLGIAGEGDHKESVWFEFLAADKSLRKIGFRNFSLLVLEL